MKNNRPNGLLFFFVLAGQVYLVLLVPLAIGIGLVTPLYCGDPAGIQTQDLQNRNLTLYSAKLQGLRRNALVAKTAACGIGRPRFLLLTRAHAALVILRSYDLFLLLCACRKDCRYAALGDRASSSYLNPVGIEVVMLLRRVYSLATNETMRLSQRLPLGRN